MGLGEQILKLRESPVVLFARALHQQTYQLLLEPAVSSATLQTFLPLPRAGPALPRVLLHPLSGLVPEVPARCRYRAGREP